MTARDEQETTFTMMRDDAFAFVYTSNLTHLRRLRKQAATAEFIVEVRGGDDWAEFRVHAENMSPLLAIRRKRPRSAAQVAASRAAGEAAARRLAKAQS